MTRLSLFILIAAVAGLYACGAFDVCTPNDERCDAGSIEVCVAAASGYDITEGPRITHHDGTPAHWLSTTACGAAELCHTEVSPTDDTETAAFCTLDATPDPACTGIASGSFGCAGTTRISCVQGFAVERLLCASCSSGTSACPGSIESPCTQDTDCAPGLTCIEQACAMTCDCAEGAACSSCDILEQESPGGDPAGDSPGWKCFSGKCF